MSKSPRYLIPFGTVVLFLSCFASIARPDIIDFESLGVPEGDPVPTINGITFSADLALQGGAAFAFGGVAGNDTGSAPPFDSPGNAFITNPGGSASPVLVKTLEMFFPMPVTNVSFFVADIDSAPNLITEHLIAEAFDSNDLLLASLTHTAPTTGNLGDGEVVLIDFGSVGNIMRLNLRNDPVFNPNNNTQIGWGVDNLSFTIVPEPSTLWIVFTVGLAAATVVRGRRTTQPLPCNNRMQPSRK